MKCGHLVGEELDWSISILLHQWFLVVFQHEWVAKEVTSKSTKYQDLVLRNLAATSTLSHWEVGYVNVYNFPYFLIAFGGWIESLDRVKILFGRGGNTRKNINEPVGKTAWGVVVSSEVHIRQVKPNIHVNVVLFHGSGGIVFIDAGASHHEELILETDDWVTMTRWFERIFAQAVELGGTVVEDLEALDKWLVVRFLEITTTNYKESLGGSLHILEVVRVVWFHINGILGDDTFGNIKLEDDFAVSLANVEWCHLHLSHLLHLLLSGCSDNWCLPSGLGHLELADWLGSF